MALRTFTRDNHNTFCDKGTLSKHRSLLAPVRESRDYRHEKEKKVNLFILYRTPKRLAQPAKKKGRPSKKVTKLGSFSLNKYYSKG